VGVLGVDVVALGVLDVDAEHTHASTEKARELIGYEPTHTVREGVTAYVEWYRENREWYEPLIRGD